MTKPNVWEKDVDKLKKIKIFNYIYTNYKFNYSLT